MRGHAPWPPVDIATRRLAIRILPAGARLHRFYTKPYEPIHFDHGPAGRFNAPDGSYGVLYSAQSLRGAFAETFLRQPGKTLLARDHMDARDYVVFELSRALRCVRLYGRGLAMLGCTAEATHGGLPYDLPDAWSKALHEHEATPDGIAYRARHDDNEICYATTDRGQEALTVHTQELDLDRDWFYRLCDYYGVGMAPAF